MASAELLNKWNKRDENGAIEPPLTASEVDALASRDIYPQTRLKYDRYNDMARMAFISCAHFRIIGNPDLTAETVAAFK